VRVVHPDTFDLLLTHLQPAKPTAGSVALRDAQDGVMSSPPSAIAIQASTQFGARGAAPSVVRAWAIENGLEVGVRGRLHADIFGAYWLSVTRDGGGQSGEQ
jgi:DNA polymerase-3 subunit epsilon